MALLSCSGADPRIIRAETHLQVYWNYPKEFNERLIIQLLADDDDGFDDIYEVYIINDAEEIYWRSTIDEWDIVPDDENNDWIVLTNILSERHGTIARGEYRIVLMDYSGFRSEQKFSIDAPAINYNRQYFPTFAQVRLNTYVPTISVTEESKRPIFLELAYPKIEKDATDNELVSSYKQELSYLGQDGTFYEIERGRPVKFVLDGNSRAIAYLHYVNTNGVIFTSGPYNMRFKSSSAIPQINN